MIKRICISSKFEQLPRKKEGELLSRTKTDSELIQMVLRISTRARSKNCLYCLELHRTFFFLRIGNGLTSFWLDESVPIKMHARMRDWPAMSKPIQSKKSQRPILTKMCHSEMISCVEFTQRLHIYIYEVIYIFRLQLPVKFVFLLRASYLFSRTGEKKTGAQQIFSPARAVDKFENSAMCTIPNSDVPTLLGCQPNTSLAFE